MSCERKASWVWEQSAQSLRGFVGALDGSEVTAETFESITLRMFVHPTRLAASKGTDGELIGDPLTLDPDEVITEVETIDGEKYNLRIIVPANLIPAPGFYRTETEFVNVGGHVTYLVATVDALNLASV